ncbi:MAG: ABC transporter ATP-binding protein [Gammaproteobacteria bacterium]
MSVHTVARLADITKRYGNVTAVDDLNLDVHQGEILALLGPNGAGKTTSVNLLLGLAQPTAGQAELFGRPPREIAVRRRIGTMLQDAQLDSHARVREVLALYAGYYPDPMSVREALELAGIEALSERPVTKLSGGQKQRLMFALALCGNPELLFLDEPTAGLDVEARRALWSTLRALAEDGRTIVLTTHYLEEADALADRIVVVNRGRIVSEGSPEEIKSTVAQRRIRCVTRLTSAQVQELSGVTTVKRDGTRLEITASHPESVVFELLKLDATLHNLEVTGARLEDAFLALTEDSHLEQAA